MSLKYSYRKTQSNVKPFVFFNILSLGKALWAFNFNRIGALVLTIRNRMCSDLGYIKGCSITSMHTSRPRSRPLIRLACTLQSSLSIIVVALTLICMFGGCSSEITPPQDLIALGSQNHHFGEVGANTTNRHWFVLRNVGNEPLQLTEVVSGCACSTIEVESPDFFTTPLNTGDERRIGVSMRVEGFESSRSADVLLKYRNLNRPMENHLKLSLSANVLLEYELSKSEWDLGEVSDEEIAPRQISVDLLCRDTEKSVEFRSFECNDPRIEVSIENPKLAKLRFQSLDIRATQSINSFVQFRTSSTLHPNAVLRVRGVEKSSVEISPSVATISSTEVGQIAREFLIKTLSPSTVRPIDMKLDSCSCQDPRRLDSRTHTIEVMCFDTSNEYQVEIPVEIEFAEGRIVATRLRICRFEKLNTIQGEK
jgi:hypothetical protein